MRSDNGTFAITILPIIFTFNENKYLNLNYLNFSWDFVISNFYLAIV